MKRSLFLSIALLVASLGVAAQSIMPFGTPTNVAVLATASSASVPAVAKGGSGSMELMLSCIGTQTCFYRYDGTAATVSNGFPLASGQQMQVKVPATTTSFSVIAGATGSTFYIHAVR